jgi:CRISPR-associated protein Cas5t
MMTQKLLQIKLEGWTATPRLPFVLSGNALCLPVPTYSILLGMIGCCLGRLVEAHELKIGFRYEYDSTNQDMETRQRLEYDGKKVKNHAKGSDAHIREFHAIPKLTVWIDRLDWENYFRNPVGTPSLGRSQDIMKIEDVNIVEVNEVNETTIGGTMLPFDTSLKIGGQLVRLAEAFEESESIGEGRKATAVRMFLAIPSDNVSKVSTKQIFEVAGEQETDQQPKGLYLHTFNHAN